MLARTLCFALQGVDGQPVWVETDVTGGMGGFSMVGLPDTAVRESRDRVTGALRNSGFAMPGGRVYVNLTGNNGMGKGGSGDMLAGMAAAFLANGADCETAAAAAVYYHGLAGDRCAEKYSRRAMLPSDMIAELKQIF